MKIHLLLCFFILEFAFAFKPLSALAQDCQTIPVTIAPMDDPDIGAYNLWDYVEGDYPQAEAFQSGLYDGQDMIFAGVQTHPDDPDAPVNVLLTKLDYRGRALWRASHEIAYLKAVLSVQPHPKGLTVLGTRVNAKNEHSLWLAVFSSENGSLIFEKNLTRVAENVHGAAMITALPVDDDTPSEGYAVAGYIPNQAQKPGYTNIYNLDYEGHLDLKRSYRSGAGNIVHTIFRAGSTLYVVGEALGDQGQPVGWIAALDNQLRLIWERMVPRGAGLRLQAGSAFGDEMIVVSGQSIPLDRRQTTAGSVLAFDARNGDVIWERYYRAPRAYTGGPVMENFDRNTVSLVLNGAAHPSQATVDPADPLYMVYAPHARLITLNKRGEPLFFEDYKNGLALDVRGIMRGQNDNRILFGTTQSADMLLEDQVVSQMTPQDGEVPSSPTLPAFVSPNAWAIGLPVAKLYDDPCQPWAP